VLICVAIGFGTTHGLTSAISAGAILALPLAWLLAREMYTK
jgi:hypothetical protein